MAYKYEIEKKKNSVKIRVLIAVYIMFVVSSILIGIAVRLQQLQNIRPTAPQAAGELPGFTIGAASDPDYEVRQLGAIAYCDIVDSSGNPTGEHFPLSVKFDFKKIVRDVGNAGTPLSSSCASTTSQSCNWKTAPEGYTCRDGQTVTQCSDSPFDACPNTDSTVPGVLGFSGTSIITGPSGIGSYLALWPTGDLGLLVFDDNEVDVTLNQYVGDLANDSVVHDGVTYRINKDSLSTFDTSSILPIYGWECNNDTCTDGGSCTAADYVYSSSPCTFANGSFTCQTNKYVHYPDLLNQGVTSTYFYRRNNKEGQVGSDASWVRMGMAYSAFVDSSYDNADPSVITDDQAYDFNGNIAKFKYTCQEVAVTTPPPTITPSILISATKTGPVCVERVAPNNEAPFTITVTNNGDTATVIEAVKDSLPQGFTYSANSTVIDGVPVPDTFVITTNSGTSQLVTFEPPENEPLWTLDVGETMTITFTTIASTTAVTGTNTNSVVIVIDGTDAIDNITYQFPVEQTCSPITGVFDEPILVFALSGVFIIFGLYIMYSPNGDKLFVGLGEFSKKLEKSVQKTDKKLRNKADVKKNFEKKVMKSRKKK